MGVRACCGSSERDGARVIQDCAARVGTAGVRDEKVGTRSPEYNSHMVDRMAHDPSQTKLQTALVSKWPEGFDIESDITKQGKADTFQRTLTSALRTRGMLQPIVEAQPTLDEVLRENPGRSVDEAQDFLDEVRQVDDKAMATVADLLMPTIKFEALLQHEKNTLNAWATAGKGREIYAWIMQATTLGRGKPQDAIRNAYAKVPVARPH